MPGHVVLWLARAARRCALGTIGNAGIVCLAFLAPAAVVAFIVGNERVAIVPNDWEYACTD